MSELDYCTQYTVYAVEQDPGEGDLVDIDKVLAAGVEALGLDGKFAAVESDLVDCGRGLW